MINDDLACIVMAQEWQLLTSPCTPFSTIPYYTTSCSSVTATEQQPHHHHEFQRTSVHLRPSDDLKAEQHTT